MTLVDVSEKTFLNVRTELNFQKKKGLVLIECEVIYLFFISDSRSDNHKNVHDIGLIVDALKIVIAKLLFLMFLPLLMTFAINIGLSLGNKYNPMNVHGDFFCYD
jgi:hypothetical protein